MAGNGSERYSKVDSAGHFHVDSRGMLHKCYHTCRHWLSPAFLAGWIVASTITFGPEHMLWEKIWPFYVFTTWMEGLQHAPYWLSAIVNLLWLFCVIIGIRVAARKDDELHD